MKKFLSIIIALTAVLAVGCGHMEGELAADVADQQENVTEAPQTADNVVSYDHPISEYSSREERKVQEYYLDLSDEIEEEISKRGWIDLEKDPNVIAQEPFVEDAYLSLSGDENFDISDLTYVGKEVCHAAPLCSGEDPIYFFDLYIAMDGREYYFDEFGRLRHFINANYIFFSSPRDTTITASETASAKMDSTGSNFVQNCMSETDGLSFEPADDAFTYRAHGESRSGEDVAGLMKFTKGGDLRSLDIRYCDFSQGIDEDYFQQQIDDYISEKKSKHPGGDLELIDYDYSVEYIEVYGKIYAILNIEYTYRAGVMSAELVCFG